MAIMSDNWISKKAKEEKIIEPFESSQVRMGKISYGLSSYGYDARVADEYKIFTNVNNALVDPKNFSNDGFVERKAPVLFHLIVLFYARTVEYFRILETFL